MARKPFRTCTGEAVPLVHLALEKAVCLRSTGEKVRVPSEVVAMINRLYGCNPQEHFFAVYISSANEVLGVQLVSTGGLNTTQVDPRVLYAGALMAGASALILVHNHPAGDPTPSAVDLDLTKQLIAGAKLLGIRIIDHIVIARGGSHTSMRMTSGITFDDAPG